MKQAVDATRRNSSQPATAAGTTASGVAEEKTKNLSIDSGLHAELKMLAARLKVSMKQLVEPTLHQLVSANVEAGGRA